MTKFDPASLPDYAARNEAARLYEAFCKADDAANDLELCEPPVPVAEVRAAKDARDDAFNAYEALGVDLLMDGETTIQADGIEQPFIYRGFRIVNEEKLNDLRGDQLRKIHKNGMLPLLYAHLFSLSLMRDIFSRQMQLGLVPAQLPAV